jgi:hypothetical protein
VHVERHFLIDHIRRLYFIERTEVEPKPTMPNRDSARFKEALYPLIEPLDLKGVGFTFTRYMNHTRHDDTWLYLPQLRRVRRLSSAQRSDALFGQDADADSYEGYQGNVAWMTWKFLGEKTITGSCLLTVGLQFAVGGSTRSITASSSGRRTSSNLRPSSSSRTANSDGLFSCGRESVKLRRQARNWPGAKKNS